MSDALYNEKILAAARGLDPDDRLEDPQATVQLTSPLCGSRIRVDLRVADGRVAAYGQEVRACALGQSAAAIMKRHAVGRTRAELIAVRDAMEAMLKQDAPPPGGEWAELEVLAPARAHKSRHASILLPFKAVVKAFDEAAAAGASRGDAAGSSAQA
ncbi:MAG: iron-sulfur cluster assembly scaffold protein [Alphaproteobacteria bacterium]|nr:iron-sulfur cluster assembly scaffold protein [Alphaproteobacteria bacterium]